MAKSEVKTKPTNVAPKDFLALVEHPKRQEDGKALLNFFNKATGLEPKMWGPSIIGYGRYAYKYDSGHSGECFLTGFSPRKSALTLYIMPGYRDMSEKLVRLGKHRLGKSCLYINKLADIDIEVLKEIVLEGLDYMRTNYETWDE